VSLTTVFTAVMIALVAGLTNPFVPGAGRVTPNLIDQTRATMEAADPNLSVHGCAFDPTDTS
jgi:hypothetical protein